MKLTLLCSSALLLLGPAPDRIAFAPDEGLELTKTFESSITLDLVELERSFSIDGEEQEIPEMEVPEVGRVESETIVFVDEYARMSDGDIRSLKRSFTQLTSDEKATGPGRDGEPETESREGESELEGLTVVFDYDDEAEEFKIRYDGDEGDEDLLDELELAADFAALLPDDDVDVGDKWEVDASTFNAATTPGGDLAIIADPDSAERDDAMSEKFRENLSGTIELEYLGTEEDDGRELMIIGFSGEMESEFEDEQGGEGRTMTATFTVAMDLEGRLRWDPATGHAVDFESAGEHDFSVESVMIGDSEMGEIEIRNTQSFTGEHEFKATFE